MRVRKNIRGWRETGEIQSVALIGLGGVGAFPAVRLRDILREKFTVVADGARQARLRQGVVINGIRERFSLCTPEEGVPADLVIFATKNMQLPQAMEDASAFVGEGTILLSLLNGIDSEEQLCKAFPRAHTLRAFIKVPATHQNGIITLPLDHGKIFFGEDVNLEPYSPETAAVARLFQRASIPFDVPRDMVREQWLKFIANVSENQVAAVMGLCYGDFQRSEHARVLCRLACAEVTAIGKAVGVDLREEDASARESYLMTLRPEGRPSTLQDLEAGRPTEVDSFSGKVIRLAAQHHIQVPVCTFLYHAIRALEEKRATV